MPGNSTVKCPGHAGNLVVQVRRFPDAKLKSTAGCSVKVESTDGSKVDNPTAVVTDRATFKNLCAGAYTLEVVPAGEEAQCGLFEAVGGGGEASIGVGRQVRPVAIETNKSALHLFNFYPYVVRVKVEGTDGKPLVGVKVTAETEAGAAVLQAGTTDAKGVAFLGIAKHDEQYRIKLELAAPQAKLYDLEEFYGPAQAKLVSASDKEPIALEVKPKPRTLWLRLQLLDPEGTVRPFPKEFALKSVFHDPAPAAEADTNVEDDKGTVRVEVSPGAKKFSLSFPAGQVRTLVFKKDGDALVSDGPARLDASDEQLRQLTLEGKRFFNLPKAWTLGNSSWKAVNLTLPDDGQIDLPAAGLATEAAPAELTLVPQLTHVRLEFFDRQFGASDHGGKRVSLPPVVLKGARTSDAAGAPVDPVAGSHDAASNWMVDEADAALACQALPWIVTKKDGAALPKLDKDALFEVAWPDGYVHSETAAKRTILTLPPGDARRKPCLDRPAYYDLPKLWKSKNYFTRLGGPPKDRFFDELDEGDLDACAAKGTPAVFSLDDVVLVDSAGAQLDRAAMDRTDADAAAALSADSRLALLGADPADPFKLRVLEPRTSPGDTAPFWTLADFAFAKDAANDYRNVLLQPPPASRAVVFCSGFHDLFDKRAEAPDFAKKQVAGARAAKRDDPDVHFTQRITATAAEGDYASSWCGNFDLHYLAYCGVDAANRQLVFALVTYWNCRLEAGAGIVAADLDPFREKGMSTAMARWNAKDYEFRPTNRKDTRGKSFAYFEAKLDGVGGAHLCKAKVVADVGAGGSWMSLTEAQFRKSTFDVEPGRFPTDDATDYDGQSYVCMALAHELGHATGLKDAYVYDTETDLAGSTLPSLPRFKQYYPGMPYLIDEHSLMNHNQALRLHMYWGKATWLHRNLASLPGLTNADSFQVTYPGHRDLEHVRPVAESLQDVYAPVRQQTGFRWGSHDARSDLYLYRLGQDEFAHSITPGRTYNGLLVVDVRVHLRFTGAWSDAQTRQWAQNFQTEASSINDKWLLRRKSGAGEFDQTFLRFFWQYSLRDPDQTVRSGAWVDTGVDRTCTLVVQEAGTDWKPDSADKTILTVGRDCDLKKPVAYILGMNPGRFEGLHGWIRSLFGKSDKIERADFDDLASWMKAQVGVPFQLDDL